MAHVAIQPWQEEMIDDMLDANREMTALSKLQKWMDAKGSRWFRLGDVQCVCGMGKKEAKQFVATMKWAGSLHHDKGSPWYQLVTIREKVEGYLGHKWGLNKNFPDDHPYKTEAPAGPLPEGVRELDDGSGYAVSSELSGCSYDDMKETLNGEEVCP